MLEVMSSVRDSESPELVAVQIHVTKKRTNQEPFKLEILDELYEYTDDKVAQLRSYAQEQMLNLRNFSPMTQNLLTQIPGLCQSLLDRQDTWTEEEVAAAKTSLCAIEHALCTREALKPFRKTNTATIFEVLGQVVETKVLCDYGDDMAIIVDLSREQVKIRGSSSAYRLLDKRVQTIVKELRTEAAKWKQWGESDEEEKDALKPLIKHHLAINEAAEKMNEDTTILIEIFKGFAKRNHIAHSGLRDDLATRKYNSIAAKLRRNECQIPKLIVDDTLRSYLLSITQLLIKRWFDTSRGRYNHHVWEERADQMCEDYAYITRQIPKATIPVPLISQTPVLEDRENSPAGTSSSMSPSKRLPSRDATELSKAEGKEKSRKTARKDLKAFRRAQELATGEGSDKENNSRSPEEQLGWDGLVDELENF